MANLAANVASSGSLTTAATTKGSGFGAIQGPRGSAAADSTTPKRGSVSIMNELLVLPRPNNSSRAMKEHT